MDPYFLAHLCFFWTLGIINNHITEKSLYFENRPTIILKWVLYSPDSLFIHVLKEDTLVNTDGWVLSHSGSWYVATPYSLQSSSVVSHMRGLPISPRKPNTSLQPCKYIYNVRKTLSCMIFICASSVYKYIV